MENAKQSIKERVNFGAKELAQLLITHAEYNRKLNQQTIKTKDGKQNYEKTK